MRNGQILAVWFQSIILQYLPRKVQKQYVLLLVNINCWTKYGSQVIMVGAGW